MPESINKEKLKYVSMMESLLNNESLDIKIL